MDDYIKKPVSLQTLAGVLGKRLLNGQAAGH